MSKRPPSDIRSFFKRPAPAPAPGPGPQSAPATVQALSPAPVAQPPAVPQTVVPQAVVVAPSPASSSSVSVFDADALLDADLMAIDMDSVIAAAKPTPPPPRGPPRQTFQLGLFKYPVRVPKPPQMPPPDASNPSDRQRLLQLQFERFGTNSSGPLVAVPAAAAAPLNEAQRLVAEHSADQPLSVRAGAGTGKTHTMMRRAMHLVTEQNIDASAVLMLTFSVKAATELKDRLAAAFGTAPDGSAQRPVAKTFHALAIFWIRQYWLVLGLGCPPVPLTGKAGQRALMTRAIEEEVMATRLRRCCKRMPNTLPSDASWDAVLDAFSRIYPEAFARAQKAAEEEVPHDEKPAGKRKRSGGRDASEAQAEAAARAEMVVQLEQVRQISLCKYVDLEMATIGRSKQAQSSRGTGQAAMANAQLPDDLFEKWLEPKKLREHVRFYLDLVQRGRLNRHAPNEYLDEDAAIWERYERIQLRDGLIDFDCMLVLFK